MVWDKFNQTIRPSSSCSSSTFEFVGKWDDLPLAVRDDLAESKFTTSMFAECQSFWSSGVGPPAYAVQYMRDVFEGWGSPISPIDSHVMGDIAEASFSRIRSQNYTSGNVIQRAKREASSSSTPGWDLIELFLSNDPYFILWEVKGTDKRPEQQSRIAARQVVRRCSPWLAMLAGLLEEEVSRSHGVEAGQFAAKIHEFAYKRLEPFHLGVAVVTDEATIPTPSFEMFNPVDAELPQNKQWGVLIGVPSFQDLRREVVQWILVP